jgi:hypothetical protein
MKSFKQLRTEAKEVWDKPNPKAERGESEKLSSSAKARARARAKAAGRPYPNMVDNIWAARSEETVLESGGDKIFKNANGHIEKYGDDSYAVYRNGQKQTFYTTLDAAKAALSEDAKGHKNPTGGLTQKGRDYYNRKTGGNLQAPVTTPPSKLDPDSKAAGRRRSFCARMSGNDGPMKKPNGEPTRKALALRKWNC